LAQKHRLLVEFKKIQKRRIDMTGVEILTTEQVATSQAYNWTVALIVAGAFFVATILCRIFLKELFDIGSCLALIICGIVFGSIMGVATSTSSEYVTQHQVLVSEDVSFTEFYERYDVIKQDGKLFTVRRKDTSLGTEK
jgi:Na+/H+ antiporter NhaB